MSSSKIRLVFMIILSIVLFYLAIKFVSLDDLLSNMKGARLSFIGLALISVVINTLAKVVRWRALLGEKGSKVPFITLLAALLTGQMLNTLTVTRLGDLSRAYVVGGSGVGRAYAFSTVVLEKLLDTFAYGLLIAWLVLLVPLPGWVNESIYGFIFIAFGILFGMLVFVNRAEWIEQMGSRLLRQSSISRLIPYPFRMRLESYLHSAVASMTVLRNKRTLFQVAVWSAVVWGTAVLNNYLILLAVGREISPVMPKLSASLLVLVGLQAGLSIPSIPGRIGLFQYICVLALSVFGVGQATALTYGILLQAVVMVPSTLAGLIAFLMLGLPGKKHELEHLAENVVS